ncbi:cold-shock protein [Nocardia asteroides]|uniref:cold-shock protein n=1 Tax=Nocardia asteroides TaxID=1824 RepID=UPI001E40F321|nr:cold shock domain-containing protein [Nocardia asteroides]UGT60986.1 cold shock domain-containing protein [Nocardia asteroides]
MEPRSEWRTGTVAWFDAAKGFGFIRADDHAEVFVEFGSIDQPGYRTLAEGQQVRFTSVQGRTGAEAAVVRPLGAEHELAA